MVVLKQFLGNNIPKENIYYTCLYNSWFCVKNG